jgi:ATP-binding cassette subfamily C (CFTR/MRP) protein 1
MTKGSVSFCPQTPFIMNETLRAHILFGLPFDEGVYERVIDACCLRQDIEQLGEFGDLVEIGERGVTLSGGG